MELPTVTVAELIRASGVKQKSLIQIIESVIFFTYLDQFFCAIMAMGWQV